MDPARQGEVYRAFIKDKLRESGLRFDRNSLLRNLGQEVQKFNERHKLSSPLTRIEILETYISIMKELTNEHFQMVEAMIAGLKKPSAT